MLKSFPLRVDLPTQNGTRICVWIYIVLSRLHSAAERSEQDVEILSKRKIKHSNVIVSCSYHRTSPDMQKDFVCACLQHAAIRAQPVQRSRLFQDLSVCTSFLCQVSSLCLDRPGQPGSPLSTLRPNTHIYQSTA